MKKIAFYYVAQNDSDYENEKNLQVIDEWCMRNGYEYDLYTDSVEHRNDTSNRKSLNKLKKKISDGVYDMIAIKNLSNISRDIFFNSSFITYFYDYNCKVRCLDGTNPYVLVNFYIRLADKINKVNKKEEERII